MSHYSSLSESSLTFHWRCRVNEKKLTVVLICLLYVQLIRISEIVIGHFIGMCEANILIVTYAFGLVLHWQRRWCELTRPAGPRYSLGKGRFSLPNMHSIGSCSFQWGISSNLWVMTYWKVIIEWSKVSVMSVEGSLHTRDPLESHHGHR